MIEFFLGGSRSGKSKLAEQAASISALDVIYIATCNSADTSNDRQMQERIDQHKQRRPEHWELIEEPFDLARVIEEKSSETTCLLVDCLTLWLSNCLFKQTTDIQESSAIENLSVFEEHLNTPFFEQQKNTLLNALNHAKGNVIFVSNETNMGVVPMGKLSRVFCDEAGLLHQDIAAISDKVTLAVAGLPHVLKGTSD